MKKILLTTAAVAAISTSAFASDMVEKQFYVRGDAMGFMPSGAGVKDTHFGLDVGVGYNAMDNLRFELVYNKPFTGSIVSINTLLARVGVDVVDLGMGKIFLTGGLGSSRWSISNKSAYAFSWSVGGGAAFDVADSVHLDVGYSYRSYAQHDLTKTHNLSAGIRFDI